MQVESSPESPVLGHPQPAVGYMHRDYAESLAEFGAPCFLPRCGGYILKRNVPGAEADDAMGCYPFFACQDWMQLGADLEGLSGELVSLAMVTDPFGAYEAEYLSECFKEVAIPYKQHYVTDLHRPAKTFVHKSHHRTALKALRAVRVESSPIPLDSLEEWTLLYANLISRHQIKGIPAFSRAAFAKQLVVPGIEAFRAVQNNITVAMTLWYTRGEVAYYHLGASSALGYTLDASFALFSHAIEHFAQRGLRWLSLGAAAGLETQDTSGLNRFKAGWSTGYHTAYFCGRVFDARKYAEIVAAKGIAATTYFPAYRVGEFR